MLPVTLTTSFAHGGCFFIHMATKNRSSPTTTKNAPVTVTAVCKMYSDIMESPVTVAGLFPVRVQIYEHVHTASLCLSSGFPQHQSPSQYQPFFLAVLIFTCLVFHLVWKSMFQWRNLCTARRELPSKRQHFRHTTIRKRMNESATARFETAVACRSSP